MAPQLLGQAYHLPAITIITANTQQIPDIGAVLQQIPTNTSDSFCRNHPLEKYFF